MKAFEIFLLFVSLWVIVFCAFMYAVRVRTAAYAARLSQSTQPGSRPDSSPNQCCLEVACSERCAREMCDLVKVRYADVVREIGHIIEAGQNAPVPELEAPDYALEPEEDMIR